MAEILFFLLIFGILVFIWGYVFSLRKQKDSATVAFLFFLAVILLWMVLSISNFFDTSSGAALLMQKIYWIVLLNMATVFLYFIYKLVERKLDLIFWFLLSLNTLTIIVRFFYELDYSKENFWRISEIKTATIMASIFTLPMLWAIILIILEYRRSKDGKDGKNRTSIKFLVYGVSAATALSIISEFIGPILFPKLASSSFMYSAILVLVLFLVKVVVKERFLNVEMEYIYEELFLNSTDGVLLINNQKKIESINQAAKDAICINDIKKGQYINSILPDYDYYKDNIRYEVFLHSGCGGNYLLLSQNPIRIDNQETMKLLHVMNVTKEKNDQIEKMHYLNDKLYKDPLTDLYNRRYYEEVLIKQSYDLTDNIVILFIDIDNFKQINDKYGHASGDDVIKICGDCIQRNIRSDESAFRYGGDEFVAVLVNVRKKDADKIAQSISDSFDEMIKQKFGSNQQVELSIGISIGRKNIEALIHDADSDMYRKKMQRVEKRRNNEG